MDELFHEINGKYENVIEFRAKYFITYNKIDAPSTVTTRPMTNLILVFL